MFNWKNLWTPNEYAEEFARQAEGRCPEELSVLSTLSISNKQPMGQFHRLYVLRQVYQAGIVLSFALKDLYRTLESIPHMFEDVLADVHKATIDSLLEKRKVAEVVAEFRFPKEVAVPCEQYLMYFIQFLQDLGIAASAQLEHNAGRVLFSVRPVSREVALDKIREALSIYLQIPMHPLVQNGMASVGDVQTQQLIANVHHLQGQLVLANAIIQTKDAAIYAHMVTIAQQNKALDAEILSKSLVELEGYKKENLDKEELFGGLFAVTKYRGKGYEINIPQIFRYLRELFSNK
jgi:hypothetical protein